MEVLQALISKSVGELFNVVKFVAKTAGSFKSELNQLEETLEIIVPVVDRIVDCRQILNHSEGEYYQLVILIQDCQCLVLKCCNVKWNVFKRFTHSIKLKRANAKLLRFFQLEVQGEQLRDLKEILLEMRFMRESVANLDEDFRSVHQSLRSNETQAITEAETEVPGLLPNEFMIKYPCLRLVCSAVLKFAKWVLQFAWRLLMGCCSQESSN